MDKIIGEKLKNSVLEKNPLLKMFLNDSLIEKIKSYFKKVDFGKQRGNSGRNNKKSQKTKIDFKEIMLEKMKNFFIRRNGKKLFLSVSKNEFETY